MRRIRDLLYPIVPPESPNTTKSWNATFGAYACAGKNKNSVIVAKW